MNIKLVKLLIIYSVRVEILSHLCWNTVWVEHKIAMATTTTKLQP